MNIHSSATINQVSLNALHRAEHARIATVPRKAKLSRTDRAIRDARVAHTASALRGQHLNYVLGYMPLV